MPAFSAHYLFARELLPALEEFAASQPLQPEALFLGTQGPDVFLFHRLIFPGKSYRAISSTMHRMPPSLLFDAMAKEISESEPSKALISYAYGFLCHYALDCTVHPFVYAKQAELRRRHPLLAGFTLHNRVEFGLDSVLLHDKLRLEKPHQFETGLLLSSDEELLDTVSAFLQRVVERTMPGTAPVRGKMVEAWRDFRRMQKILRDARGFVRPLLQSLETLLFPLFFGFLPSSMLRPKSVGRARERYCNDAHRPWRAPAAPETVRTESFSELWENAGVLARSLVPAFERVVREGGSMAQVTGERSFLTGEPVKKKGNP